MLELLKPKSIVWISVICLGLIALLGYADFFTGYEISLSVFYLLPIALGGWYIGILAGLCLSFLSAFTWVLANIWAGEQYTSSIYYWWNMLVHLGFYTLFTYVHTQLRSALVRQQSLTSMDELTGALNRRAFLDRLDLEVQQAKRYAQVFTLVYLDIDDFKLINDRLGQRQGDQVLQFIASLIMNDLRSTDCLARLGGDEYAIFLHRTDKTGATTVIQRLQEKLNQLIQRMNWNITLSIGVVTFEVPPETADLALSLSDQVMTNVKSAGKNGLRYSIFMGNTAY